MSSIVTSRLKIQTFKYANSKEETSVDYSNTQVGNIIGIFAEEFS